MQNPSFPLNRDGRLVLAHAKRLTEQHDLPSIDSEVLLLALLQIPKSPAREGLRLLNVKVENLIARLSATLKLSSEEARAIQRFGSSKTAKNLSPESLSILQEAQAEAQLHNLKSIDGRLLLLGMLRCPDSSAGKFLGQYFVTAEQFRERSDFKTAPSTHQSRIALPNIKWPDHGISPIFISLVLFALLAGGLTYAGIGNNRIFMIFFIITGWIISVCLHEFAHAITAYWGGDESVAEQGYLTLNPLKYTHPILSIVIPVIFLLMGGIGLPGGAVYINTRALRSAKIRSLVSAAGPLANILCALVLALPFIFIPYRYLFTTSNFEFIAGLAFLAFLQITAVLINLLPIPGLDGFGVIEPFLSAQLVEWSTFIRPFSFLILFMFISVDSPIQDLFWRTVWHTISFINPEMAYFANEGLKIFLK